LFAVKIPCEQPSTGASHISAALHAAQSLLAIFAGSTAQGGVSERLPIYQTELLPMSCCAQGPLGYATPLEAFKNGPREKLLYVVAVVPDKSRWVRLGSSALG
jgi:hypothetical protein